MKAVRDGERSVLVILPDGVRRLDPVDGEVDLDWMYARLGCRSVDLVRLSSAVEMWVDDEALPAGRPVNVLATALAAAFGFTYQLYRGPALVCGFTPEGAVVGLDRATAENLLEFGGSGPDSSAPSPRGAGFRADGGGL